MPLIERVTLGRTLPVDAVIEDAKVAHAGDCWVIEIVPLDPRAYRFDIVLRGCRQTLLENKLEGS
jgi:hypothetical protein